MGIKSLVHFCILLQLVQSTLANKRLDCTSPANKIVAENCLDGVDSTTWDVNGAGDPSIQGFSTDISVDAGETVYFKVKTPADKWRVDIFRLGFYNGTGARLVDTVLPHVSLPQMQPPCFKEEATHLVDCGNWAVSAVWKVPKDATSGLYIARPVREDIVPAEYVEGGLNWRSDNSFQRGDRTHAKPGDDDYVRPKKDYHAYGATGFGKLRNPIKGISIHFAYCLVESGIKRASMFSRASSESYLFRGSG